MMILCDVNKNRINSERSWESEMKALSYRFLASAAVAAIVVSSPAFAQEGTTESQGGIQEIVVTAQKRAENVQDVPIAISAFTAEALDERAVTSVASLSNLAPNVTLDAGTPFSGSSHWCQ
jgi:iron complex outermembrane recepter protein